MIFFLSSYAKSQYHLSFKRNEKYGNKGKIIKKDKNIK